MRTVNFFWKGNNFTYLNRLTILSHIRVGHNCIIWLSGAEPNSKFWIKDQPVLIKNADPIFNVTQFLNNGGNIKTASDLWRFHFLYKYGGLYCDTDAIAIKSFPEDDWILVSSFKTHPKERLSIGVIGAPPNEKLFKECVKNIKYKWGNVTLFADEYFKIYGHTNSTHDDKLFYPFNWQEWNTLFKNIQIPDVYSVHLYHTMLERNNKIYDKTQYPKQSLLGKLISTIDGT